MEPTIFVGDIHGCHKTLQALMDSLLDSYSKAHYIFLGDYIDRGPDSKGVIDRLMQFSNHYRCTFLKGNHEALMEDFLNEGENQYSWAPNGGTECLQSYGVKTSGQAPQTVRAEFKDILKRSGHLAFFDDLETFYEGEDFIAVHGGLDPDFPQARDPETLLWIRDKFISSSRDFGKKVIFGHTPRLEGPLNQANKCGIDTGCVYGGHLTALVWPQQEFVQIKNQEKRLA